MKKLYIMCGAPASGKSTWISKNGLSNYVISTDKLRTLIGGYQYGVYEATPNNDILVPHVDNHHEPFVWDLFYKLIDEKMYAGETIVVDNTGLFKGAFTKIGKLRKKYNYKVILVDMMARLFHEKNIEQVQNILKVYNQKRQFKVPDSTIDRYVHRYINIKEHFPDWLKVVEGKLDQPQYDLFDYKLTPNMEKFDRLQVIGDIHADYDALMEVFKSHTKGTAYIFVGDYLDRGTKTLETFKFITQELQGNNLFFCIGNHERPWEDWLWRKDEHGQFKRLSLPKLLDEYSLDELDTIIADFDKRAHDYFIFDFYGKRYYVSHAGFEPYLVESGAKGELYNRNTVIYGLGNESNYEDAYSRDIDKAWSKQMPANLINLHGHRNNFNCFQVGNNSYNLTQDGKFRWLTITKNGIEKHEIDRIDVPSLDQQLEDEFHIHRRTLDDNIVANNFDKAAFYQNIWNGLTTKARGLFTRNNQVVGRGFNKFFQVDQMPDSTIDSLEFPVIVERKHNGFLGIAFYDTDTDKIRIYSKSGSDVYSPLAETMLKQLGWYDRLVRYYEDKVNQDTTVLFEIVVPNRSQHPIRYESNAVFPLAIIKNDMSGAVLNLKPDLNHEHSLRFRDLADDIANENVIGKADNIEELKKIIEAYETTHPHREGLVMYGQNKMLKIKSPYYLKAKELRQALQKHGLYKYWYGADLWVEACRKLKITKFNFYLPLALEKLHINSMKDVEELTKAKYDKTLEKIKQEECDKD